MLSVLLIYGVIFITTYWLGRGFLHGMRSGLLLPAQMLSYIP